MDHCDRLEDDLPMDDALELKRQRALKEELVLEINRLRQELRELDEQLANIQEQEEDPAVGAKAKQMSIGINKFNMDHKKGVEYLVQNGLIERTPQCIAKFLFKGGEGRLKKGAIGDYLGERGDFPEAVLAEFANQHEFQNMNLVASLRQFLMTFRLPGEAQKISRIMDAFAARYCALVTDPSLPLQQETCGILAYAIIFLNTSIHNPNVKPKLTQNDFMKMVHDLEGGDQLPTDFVERIFESIRKEPFKFPEGDDGTDFETTFFNPEKEGWLWKQDSGAKTGGRYKSWKHRWFILKDACLYYFEHTTDKEPRGIIPLVSLDVREVDERGGRAHSFEVFSVSNEVIKACKTTAGGGMIEGKHSVYRLSAKTENERGEWIQHLSTAIRKASENHTSEHSAFAVAAPFQDYIARRSVDFSLVS